MSLTPRHQSNLLHGSSFYIPAADKPIVTTGQQMIISRQDFLREVRTETNAVDSKIMSLFCSSEKLSVADQSRPDLHSTTSVGGDEDVSVRREGDGEHGGLVIRDGAHQVTRAQIPETHGLRDQSLHEEWRIV